MGCMGCGGSKKKQAPRNMPKPTTNPTRQLYSPKKNITGYGGFGTPRIKMSSRSGR